MDRVILIIIMAAGLLFVSALHAKCETVDTLWRPLSTTKAWDTVINGKIITKQIKELGNVQKNKISN